MREIGDEEAFRLADLENRARDDLPDFERAKDYLRALSAYYEGRQKTMAERLKVSESWLTRYLDLMNRDPLLGEVRGVFAAQQIKPQARTLATDRGISCLVVDYDALRGLDHAEDRLF